MEHAVHVGEDVFADCRALVTGCSQPRDERQFPGKQVGLVVVLRHQRVVVGSGVRERRIPGERLDGRELGPVGGDFLGRGILVNGHCQPGIGIAGDGRRHISKQDLQFRLRRQPHAVQMLEHLLLKRTGVEGACAGGEPIGRQETTVLQRLHRQRARSSDRFHHCLATRGIPLRASPRQKGTDVPATGRLF